MFAVQRRAAFAIAAAAVAVFAAGYTVETSRDGALVPDRIDVLRDLAELSGLAWNPETSSLVAVTDEGRVADLGVNGTLRSSRAFFRKDLEDVCWDPARKELCILEEKGSRLFRVAPDTLRLLDARHVLRSGAGGRNHNHEGLALAATPDRAYLASESRPAAFAAVEPGAHEPGCRMLTGASSLTALVASPGGDELLLVSRERGLMIVTTSGRSLTPWRRVAAASVEAAALVPGEGLVLGTDERRSRLLWFRGLDAWGRLKEVLRDGP